LQHKISIESDYKENLIMLQSWQYFIKVYEGKPQ
jgi:hypothetical protein